MNMVVPVPDAAGRLRLVGRTSAGADVLAVAHAGRDMTAREALRRLWAGTGTVHVVPAGDAHFRWTLTGPDGGVIAESPAIYRSPGTCQEAFADARRAARTALGRDAGAGPGQNGRTR